MEETKTIVSVNELRRLIISIVEGRFEICIRFRLIGQLWHPNFLRIVKLTEGSGVLFHDETQNKLFSLSDLGKIVQFELDSSLYAFEPNCHYQVTTNENYKLEK
jgi:hypothetical protein